MKILFCNLQFSLLYFRNLSTSHLFPLLSLYTFTVGHMGCFHSFQIWTVLLCMAFRVVLVHLCKGPPGSGDARSRRVSISNFTRWHPAVLSSGLYEFTLPCKNVLRLYLLSHPCWHLMSHFLSFLI